MPAIKDIDMTHLLAEEGPNAHREHKLGTFLLLKLCIWWEIRFLIFFLAGLPESGEGGSELCELMTKQPPRPFNFSNKLSSLISNIYITRIKVVASRYIHTALSRIARNSLNVLWTENVVLH
jgi:hypothetical protein